MKAKKKLLDRKTEEAVSLAQSHGLRSLIPDWCKAPEAISPPEVESRSVDGDVARPLRREQNLRSRKKRRRRKKNDNSPWSLRVSMWFRDVKS